MGRAAARALAVLAVAGCEPTIELSLEADPATAASTADLSCVRSVDVYAYSAPDVFGAATFTNDCAGIAAPGIRTIADLPLAAGVSLDIPRPLDSVFATGDDGVAGDCTGWPMLGAMSFYDGGDQLRLLARPLLDCGDRLATPPRVGLIDFVTLLTDHTCAPPAQATTLRGWLGVLADFGTSVGLAYAGGELTSDGAGVMATTSMYRGAVGDACVAVEVYDDGARYQVACVYPDQPNPCGGAGELLYPMADAAILDDSVDARRLFDRGGAVVTLVLDAQGAPVAGATVTGFDAAQADLIYTSQAGATLTATTATATDGSGTFILYPSAPTAVEITAGARTRRVVLGTMLDGRPAPAVVVL